MEAILKPILDSPQLRNIVADLQDYLHAEDERRAFFYDTITEHDKAEFINGEIVMHSPVVLAHHNASVLLCLAMREFVGYYGLGMVGYEKLMIRLTRNDYEPDLCFFGLAKAQNFEPEQKLFPAPDWVVEVLRKSTEKNDRGVKMEDYALHGVKEYWLADTRLQYVEQYYIKHGSFSLNKIYSNEDIIESQFFAGLRLPVGAIFDEKLNKQYRKQFF